MLLITGKPGVPYLFPGFFWEHQTICLYFPVYLPFLKEKSNKITEGRREFEMTDEDPSDEHIIEAIGKTRVIIRNGRVISVGEPLIKECPLARRFARPVHTISPDEVAENIRYRISSFGMCTPDRQVTMSGEFVGFGASELISFGISRGLLDAAVLVCDGAGTVIATNPGLVQGIGGRMSGLVKTTPLPEVIDAIREAGGIVVNPSDAGLTQYKGFAVAMSHGFSKVAVTVTSPDESEQIREMYPGAFIIAVHTSGISAECAERLGRSADILTSCASREIRDYAGKHALLQAGAAVPVFAMTPTAKDLILAKIAATSSQVVVLTTSLPYTRDQHPEPLV
jgi:putative methanogenesis marker protein 8